jgi:hypothetical protein
MAIELLDIKTDTDGNGISIMRRLYETINGVNYYAQPERCSFRKTTINDANETVINNNFSSELDSFTGITNFLTTFYNF